MILPCKCGTVPDLYYYDQTFYSGGGLAGCSWIEEIRYYRYICPKCGEWGSTSEFKGVAARFWNQQVSGKRKMYWHNKNQQPNEMWKKVEWLKQPHH